MRWRTRSRKQIMDQIALPCRVVLPKRKQRMSPDECVEAIRVEAWLPKWEAQWPIT